MIDGEGESPFSLEVSQSGKETLKLAGQEWRCHKIQLSLSGIMSAIFPKTVFWLDSQAPHLLITFDGQIGPPGSPRQVMELVSIETRF